MAKRIVIHIDEDYPSLTGDQIDRLVNNIRFAVDSFLEINEYMVKVENNE